MNDAHAWALIALLAATFVGLFAEGRSERKEIRGGFQSLRDKMDALAGDLSELKVLVGRMDERLKNLETR